MNCVEIKQNETLKQIPVIMYSTSYEDDIIDLLYENGAHYFIRKPCEFSQLKKIIQQAVTLLTQKIIIKPDRENFVLTIQNEPIA